MIAEISVANIIADCRATLGLPPLVPGIDDAFLAALLRRSAGINCPCSPTTLRKSVLEGLKGLTDEPVEPEHMDALIGRLIIGGDLLELHDVTTTDEGAKGTWVFAAPPSFVVRPDGSIFLFGTVPDQDAFLPSALLARTKSDGFTRALHPEAGEDLRVQLAELGLQEVPEATWLKSPRATTAESFFQAADNRLRAQPPSGDVPDFELIDPATKVTYYKGRWTKLSTKLDGIFVGRRPQEFGSPIWCLASVTQGVVTRFLDLPPKKYRWRGVDYAWHLQMAIDHSRGVPQQYRRRDEGDRSRLDFFFPLPQWAERRLIVFGDSVPRNHCLFSYSLPRTHADSEEKFLREQLWLIPSNSEA